MSVQAPDPRLDPRAVFLKDYTPFSHLLDQVDLTFQLDPHATRVCARLSFRPNPARPGQHDLFLHGTDLRLISVHLNQKPVSPLLTEDGMTLPAALLPNGPFTLETEVEISPSTNTSLDGLYMSNGMYCTQCEAEGFRKITYYPDRPDVMARFHVRVEADYPVLLSNGNPQKSGTSWAQWDDPWPKPAYLFALVAGNLVAHSDTYVTKSGRKVDLNIWVRPGDETRCEWGMSALKASMAWDEKVYGREYDLDIFNIVAVDDFNMGAMENKGLNIFNSKVVLADPDIATDDDYARIEAIIAHEYFHNWTGNRITCRDWFQLCLKEGLTVFRDQQFSTDVRGGAVKRIEDVLQLRARQFREDQGPLSHPVRPESFVEINNFYTATIYEKGAEVIGMLKSLVGDAAYTRALDTYFDRHDGQAATIEDWLKVFEDVTGRDLSQFKRWYSQAGTPVLNVEEHWEPKAIGGDYILTLTQSIPARPGQPQKDPMLIPVAIGLLNSNGDEILPTTVLELTRPRDSFRFPDLAAPPILSILRGFSAPVVLKRSVPAEKLGFLMVHDTDAFNRWESGRSLAKEVLIQSILHETTPDPAYLQGIGRILSDESVDPGYRALSLGLPTEDDMAATLAGLGHVPDPNRIRQARRQLHRALAEDLQADLPGMERRYRTQGAFSPDAKSAGRRSLRLALLSLLTRLDQGQAAKSAFAAADNMTESFGSLAILLENGAGQAELAAFENRWSKDRLVMDKWFMAQAHLSSEQTVIDTVNKLTMRPDFDLRNPNRFRAVFGGLIANHAGFHQASGQGYQLLGDWLIRLDPINPQTAARISGAFETWKRYDHDRQAVIRSTLQRILAVKGLSRNLSEMVSRILEP